MENRREKILNALKESGKSCIIYGTGKFGICAAEYLLINGIDIYCFCDTDKYFFDGKEITINVNEDERIFHVINDQELSEISPKYNILSGMIDYSFMAELKRKCPQSEIVDYLDGVPGHIMEWEYVEEHKKQLKEVYDLLEDEESRKVMENYIYARLTGDMESISKWNTCPEYTYDYELLDLNRADVVIDGGAYTGDTILEMQRYVKGNVKEIYAFEPDKVTFERLKENVASEGEVHLINVGLWETTSILRFENSGTLGSKLMEEGEDEIEVVSLDDYNKKGELENVTIIKMDIEGSELEALRGAEKLLRNRMPKLAICIYHHNDDIILIPRYLSSLNLKAGKRYQFYFRQHSFSVEEMVLYAIPADE